MPPVLDLQTSDVTPQWSVAFDCWFRTEATSVDNQLGDFNTDEWLKMVETNAHSVPKDGDIKESQHLPITGDQTAGERSALRWVSILGDCKCGIQSLVQ